MLSTLMMSPGLRPLTFGDDFAWVLTVAATQMAASVATPAEERSASWRLTWDIYA